jgi:hypothetical protein
MVGQISRVPVDDNNRGLILGRNRVPIVVELLPFLKLTEH